PCVPTGVDEPVHDHVDRGVSVEPLPFARPRRTVQDLGLATRRVYQLLARRALRAQSTARDRRVGIALDLHDRLVFDEDALSATDRAIRTDALYDAVGRRRPGSQLARTLRCHCRATTEKVARTQLADDRPFQKGPTHHSSTLDPFGGVGSDMKKGGT